MKYPMEIKNKLKCPKIIKTPLNEYQNEEFDQSKRLMKEYNNFIKYKPAEAWGGPIEGNIFEWEIYFYGPKDSDYEEGLFHVKIEIPKNYPITGPKCFFLHEELYHPNVSQTDKSICLGHYFQRDWNPSITINEVIMQIFTMLKIPNYDDSYDKVIGETYREDPYAYHQIVREFVKTYAPKNI
jgi:ubiquitin-protein ligase